MPASSAAPAMKGALIRMSAITMLMSALVDAWRRSAAPDRRMPCSTSIAGGHGEQEADTRRRRYSGAERAHEREYPEHDGRRGQADDLRARAQERVGRESGIISAITVC